MIDEIITEVVKKRLQEQEEIIKQAFLRHFGFPIDKVIHDGGFTRVRTANSMVERFCYKNECFLLWDESDGFVVEEGVNYWRGILTAKYLFV